MTICGPGLVIVGSRRAAIDRACAAYPHVIQLTDNVDARPQRPNHVVIALPRDDLAVATVADSICQRIDPLAVVALTESTVVPAARVREALGLAGLGLDSAQACTDKLLMKRSVRAAGLPSADFVSADRGLTREALAQELGLPYVVKKRCGSGGRSMRFVRETGAAPDRLEEGWMAESFVDGVEMSVESFVAQRQPLFVNFTEYTERAWANIVPANGATLPVAALLELNRRVIDALQIDRGMTHMEVFLTRSGPVFGEIAVRPPGGRIMELLELAYGFDPWGALFAVETGNVPDLPQRPQRAAGSRLVHPGPGTVVTVHGRARVEAQPALVRMHLPVRSGKIVAERVGTGQSVGYALFAGERAQVEAGIASVRNDLTIELE